MDRKIGKYRWKKLKENAGSLFPEPNRNLKQVLSSSAVAGTVEKAGQEFEKVGAAYRRGVLSANERYQLYHNIFFVRFLEFVRNTGLRRSFDDRSWAQFQKDHAAWKAGGILPVISPDPWLSLHGKEACALDRMCFFKLMGSFQVPLDYFEPYPDSCLIPDCYFNAYGDGLSGSVNFSSADDGGLFSGDDPVGKTFVMTDGNGLKAEIEIVREATAEDNNNNRFVAKYIGTGTIEGFTSARRRKISVNKNGPGRIAFYLSVDNDDMDVFRGFGSWKEFHYLRDEKDARHRRYVESLMARF